MFNLKSKNIIYIVPHFKVFIKNQIDFIRPEVYKITVIMPMPYFSNIIIRLPYINRSFRFLNMVLNSNKELSPDYNFFSPTYFTLPIETLRKRNCIFAANSCLKLLSNKKINFDLIHAHFLSNGLIGVALKKRYDVPLVVTGHGGDTYDEPFRNDWYNALARYILSEADQVIAVSQFNANKLTSLGVTPRKLHVIPNGYNEKVFRPLNSYKARNKLGLPLNKKILLSIGNLVDVKGHTYLIDAMQIISRKWNDVILIIVGSGPLKELLQKKINKLGLNEKISLVGRKEHDKIPLWMNACDVFILPSLCEGFPTVIPEAMACGKPVIGAQVGGIPEIIINEEVGVLVEPKDSQELSLAIIEALDKKWHSEEILNHAKQYSWNNLVKQILRVYSEVL